MKVLITCPRAPVSIEWIKIAKRAGYKVILADSLEHPIARFYKGVKYIKIPSPKLDFNSYKTHIKKLVSEVDMVIPNCEDVFYLSYALDGDKKILMPDRQMLLKLHNKFDFFSLLNEHVKFPKTKLLTSKNTKEILKDKNIILKPVFSRFGRNVIRDVNEKNLQDVNISKDFPWVSQEFIKGEPLCNYAICQKGEVISHVAYKPKYLLNNSASTYFEYREDKRCDKFIQKFAKTNNFHGQIAFDFIDNGKDLYVLECNPRATSGLHLLTQSIDIKNNALVSNGKDMLKHCRVGYSLYILFLVKNILSGRFKELVSDHKKAVDVLEGLPFYAQFFSLYEMVKRAIKYKRHITSASTFDIEFDWEDYA